MKKYVCSGLWLSLMFPLMLQAQEKSMNLALTYYQTQLEAYGLVAADLAGLQVLDQYTTAHNQVTHIYLQQRLAGIPVQGAITNLNVHQGQVLSLNNRFVANLTQKANTQQAAISSRQALQSIASSLQLEAIPRDFAVIQAATGASQATLFAGEELSQQAIPAQLMYHVSTGHEVSLAWNIIIHTLDANHVWEFMIDAQTGQILSQIDQVIHCQWGESEACSLHPQGHVQARPWRQPDLQAPAQILGANEYHVFPMPVESPNHGVRAFVPNPSDSLASPFGWHDTNGAVGAEYTITRGNNVWAQEDLNGNNGIGNSPDGGPSLDFDFPIDFNLAPQDYVDAATVNLFYWNNLMHDVWYRYGFDEVSGNFQENNYGKGGSQGDAIFADAQDGGGLNNANFFAGADGGLSRMQMFLWGTGPTSGDSILEINSPAALAGFYEGSGANFGPGLPNNPLTGDLVFVEDGSGTRQGCSPLTNGNAINGKIAVVDRGGCFFVDKVENAQNAGAIAVIVLNNQGGGTFTMGGQNGSITIPSIMLSLVDGNTIRDSIANGVNGTIQNQAPVGNPNDRDGTLDNGIVAHEYGHGISIRLTGGPGSGGCLSNQEQAGEGWSDWFSLVMTVQAGDVGTKSRGIGTFAVNQAITGGGIRPFPYSTDMSISPYTYDDIKTFSVPHGVGSVMCAMLWDLYWALVDEYGFDNDIYGGSGGNNIAMQLVIDGMKLQPCSPGFTDVRDAILLADQINYGGANQLLIWEVFARRGLGHSADQGSTSSRSDGSEGFDLPPEFLEIVRMEKTVSDYTIQPGGVMTYTLTVFNQKDVTANNVIIKDTLPDGLSLVPGSAPCSATELNGVVTLDLGSIPPNVSLSCSFDVSLDPNHPTSLFLSQDSLEGQPSGYSVIPLVGNAPWSLSGQNPRSGQQSWFVANVAEENDQVLTLPTQTLNGGTPALVFWHDFVTEAGWDGGLVEIQQPNISSIWFDLGPYMYQNGYNGNVGSNNPAGARDAFSGNSQGYIQTKIDLSAFANDDFVIRFRFVSDNNTALDGWYIDDISFVEEVSILNTACGTTQAGDFFCDAQDHATLVSGDPLNTALEGGLDANQFKFFPNPTSQHLNLQYVGNWQGQVEISLIHALGTKVRNEVVSAPQLKQGITWELPDLPAGLYLLQVRSGKEMFVEKLLIE